MLTIDRRSLLVTGTLGVAALAVPGFAQGSALLAARGFTHAVASGEPGADTMLFWTRYVPADGGAAELAVEVSERTDFARLAGGGRIVTGPWRDHTAKVTVDGLKPGTTYFYRFAAADGTRSAVGRTRTLPDGGARSFRAAIFSCSNMGYGYFNAYAHAAARDDLDLAIHLGDYFYEYAPDNYPPAKDAVAGRVPQPLKELIALADYRLRYASYRADPDLAALHLRLPMVVQQDDHETANDDWEGGAENHQPADGDWSTRKQAAMQAWREWMPVSDEPWRAYDIGGLATLYRTDSRQLARSEQPDLAPYFKAADPDAALIAFRNGKWGDAAQTMLGSQQESWLAHQLAASVKRGQKWQVVGFGTIMGNTSTPADAANWLAPDATARSKAYVQRGLAAAKAGLPNNFDSWGGYPAARARFLKSAQAANANVVVISGDSHNAWAYDLAQDGRAAGVEFAGQAVSSPGYENALAADPRRVAAALVAANPELKWCDTSRRGYMALTITSDRVSNDWLFVDTVKTRTPRATVGHTATVRRGARTMAA